MNNRLSLKILSSIRPFHKERLIYKYNISYFLIKGLKGAADENQNRDISVKEWSQLLRLLVISNVN